MARIIKAIDNTFECLVAGKDFAFDIFQNAGIKCEKFTDLHSIEQDIVTCAHVFTGTSYGDDTEIKIWHFAKAKGIKSTAFLEHWMGYKRFFSPNLGCDFFPDTVVLTDLIAKKYFESIYGEDTVKIIPLGNPLLEEIMMQRVKNPKIDEERSTIVYFAEKIKDFAVEKTYGFNEYDQFFKLLKCMENINKRNLEVVFAMHPKHQIEEVKKILDANELTRSFSVIVAESNIKNDLLNKADFVLGVNTHVLVEAMVMGKNVCSLWVDSEVKSDFLLLKEGYIFIAKSDEDVKIFFSQCIRQKVYDVSYIENSTSKIVEYLKVELS